MDALAPLEPIVRDAEASVASSAALPTAGISIIGRAVYRGPNIYSRRAMVRIRIDLGSLEERPTDTLPGFTESLLSLLPGLGRHHCSRGHEGAFAERLREGTWLGHVAEHVALELQGLTGATVTRGKTRSVSGLPGQYDGSSLAFQTCAGTLVKHALAY